MPQPATLTTNDLAWRVVDLADHSTNGVSIPKLAEQVLQDLPPSAMKAAVAAMLPIFVNAVLEAQGGGPVALNEQLVAELRDPAEQSSVLL